MTTPDENELPNEKLRVYVTDGKYTVVQTAEGKLLAFRYGELWRNETGNNLIYSLATELDEARRANEIKNDALMFANAYISYVAEHNPALHAEADGTPSIQRKINEALKNETTN